MIKNIIWIGFVGVPLFAQGRGGIPAITEPQTAALGRMTAECAAQADAVTAARAAMTRVAYSGDAPGPAADALGAAELALANARADAFAKIQESAAKLAPNQVAALIASGGGAGRGGRGGQTYAVGGTIPGIREAQVAALTKLTTQVMPLTREASLARTAVVAATFAEPRNPVEIRARVEALKRPNLP